MDESKKDDVSPEELAAEQAALVVTKEDEVRAKVIAEFGFNEVDDDEKIKKIVAKELDSTRKLSAAIGQKIKYRDELKTVKKPAPVASKSSPQFDEQTLEKKVNETVAQTLEKRDLEAMDYPDEIKKDIERVAKIQGVSVAKALKDPYIDYKIQQLNKDKKNDEAAISRTNRSRSSSGPGSASFENPPEVDMSTKEGRDAWDKWKKDQIKKGN